MMSEPIQSIVKLLSFTDMLVLVTTLVTFFVVNQIFPDSLTTSPSQEFYDFLVFIFTLHVLDPLFAPEMSGK